MQRLRSLLPGLLAIPLAAIAGPPTDEELRAQGLAIAGQFAGSLKPALLAAMEAGGPVHAIAVCAETAPRIARELSAQSDWKVRRVSLKPRNGAAATPDRWENAQLQFFDAMASAGLPLQAVSARVGDEFRLIQPQPVGGLCLACHGESLAPAVAAALEQHYPSDRATGYRPGQVRGAISLRWSQASEASTASQ